MPNVVHNILMKQLFFTCSSENPNSLLKADTSTGKLFRGIGIILLLISSFFISIPCGYFYCIYLFKCDPIGKCPYNNITLIEGYFDNIVCGLPGIFINLLFTLICLIIFWCIQCRSDIKRNIIQSYNTFTQEITSSWVTNEQITAYQAARKKEDYTELKEVIDEK
jgi:hypothetical protein